MGTERSENLLKRLQNNVLLLQNWAGSLQNVDNAALLQPLAAGKWSTAQVLEHLNSYGRYYLPEIRKAIHNGTLKGIKPQEQFTSGWLGAYFTKTMQLGKTGEVVNKMQSPKDHRPLLNLDAQQVLHDFIGQQKEMYHLLQDAEAVNLMRLKVPISIARFITIRLGDTFQFVIAHEIRHQLQAIRAL